MAGEGEKENSLPVNYSYGAALTKDCSHSCISVGIWD